MSKSIATACLSLLLSIPLFAADGGKQLFNGKDMTGWEHVGPGSFKVENGVLKTNSGMGLLWYTGEKIGNATVKVVFRVNRPDANSGVFIRVAEKPGDEWYAVHNGYEVQIYETGDDWHRTGSIYSLSKALAKPGKKVGEWNEMEIALDGQVTRIKLNGVLVNEFRGDQEVPPRKQWYEPVRGPRPDAGYIGLQNHDEISEVEFKEISVHPIKK